MKRRKKIKNVRRYIEHFSVITLTFRVFQTQWPSLTSLSPLSFLVVVLVSLKTLCTQFCLVFIHLYPETAIYTIILRILNAKGSKHDFTLYCYLIKKIRQETLVAIVNSGIKKGNKKKEKRKADLRIQHLTTSPANTSRHPPSFSNIC